MRKGKGNLKPFNEYRACLSHVTPSQAVPIGSVQCMPALAPRTSSALWISLLIEAPALGIFLPLVYTQCCTHLTKGVMLKRRSSVCKHYDIGLYQFSLCL